MTEDDGFVVRPRSVAPRRRPPILGAGVAVLVVGLIVAGGLQRPAEGPAEAPAGPTAAAMADTTVLTPRPTPDRDRTPPPGPPTSRWTPRPSAASAPEIVAVELRPAGSNLFVHGEVYSLQVDVVVVTLEDGLGNVGESKAVRLDVGSTAFRLGASDRFNIRFEIADEVLGEGLWIRVEAYDIAGVPLEKLREPVVGPRALFGFRVP